MKTARLTEIAILSSKWYVTVFIKTFKQCYFYKVVSGLNCAALLHMTLKMNASLGGNNF